MRNAVTDYISKLRLKTNKLNYYSFCFTDVKSLV